MTTSKTSDLLAILQNFFTPREEGWIWLAIYADESDGGVVNQIEGDYEDPMQAGRSLAHIVNEIGVDHAFIALCRSEGRPTEGDRELWREIRELVSAEVLTDLVVFNRDTIWSMRAEDATAAAAG